MTPVTADLFAEPPPSAPIFHGSAKFARDGTLRLEIRRWWVENPTRWAAWLMLNPSKAGAIETDRTADRVTHFSRSWGYDGWIGVNLYPFISSKPAQMWRWADWENKGPDWHARDDLGDNLSVLDAVGREASLRVAAFGARPIKRDNEWLEKCLERFCRPSNTGDGEALYCLGTNKTQQPLHPMARGKWRVADDQKPILWRAGSVDLESSI